MDKIRRMATKYGSVTKNQTWEFAVEVLKDGVVEEFYFNDEEKAGWFFSKASKIAEDVRGLQKWRDIMLIW